MLSEQDFFEKQVIFLITKNGEKLSINNDNVIITNRDGEIIHTASCYRLFALFIIGNITLTNVLIQRAKKFGFAIIFMTSSFRPYQTISSFAQANVLLRKNQYSYTDITAAKALIKNKIRNQKTLLNTLRHKSEAQKDAVKTLAEYEVKLQDCKDVYQIMGIEGSASRVYFKNYFNNFLWTARKPRVKYDMLNALMDIGYTILFCYIEAVMSIFGFDSYVGILHKQFYMRKSLVCDLVEPFRVIIDSCIRKGINLKQFKPEDFEIINEKWLLKYKKASEYNGVFIKEILKYRQEIFLYVRGFYRSFMKNTLNTTFPNWEYHL